MASKILTTKSKAALKIEQEWLLTNSRAGFASGTLAGCNSRRYHGLLVGSLNPPAQRIMALNTVQDSIRTASNEYKLSHFEFAGLDLEEDQIIPSVFTQDTGVHFGYKTEQFSVIKSIRLCRDTDCVAITYDFSNLSDELDLTIRPFISIKDFHSLIQQDHHNFVLEDHSGQLVIANDIQPGCQLTMYSANMRFDAEPDWWFNIFYRKENQRGQDHVEDLWTPGVYSCHIDRPCRVTLLAQLSQTGEEVNLDELDVDVINDDLIIEQKDLLKNTGQTDQLQKDLYASASKFVVQRNISGEQTSTILAGFPWFLDWGRDTFISLKGLLLDTGRFETAREVLCTFASAIDEGIIPNRFDDYHNNAHYNSIDASLWFINAAFEYLEMSGDKQTFMTKLLPAVKWIVEGYYNGTKFGICADSDGLIMGGSKETQLTWMDAKSNGVVFTPRYGKAVEINALWHNAICQLAAYYKDHNGNATEAANHYHNMADEIEESFAKVFWNENLNCLYDCVLPDGYKDPSIRPNQIFAVSLKYSPLNIEQQEMVVDAVKKQLLTPYGLRSLSPDDSNYKGRYTGSMFERDGAYHQGTVWAWLMGPFIKAYLRVNNHSNSSRRRAADMIRPLVKHFQQQACINSISEVFDGDYPHNPGGCFAQAWSIAALIEAYNLTKT